MDEQDVIVVEPLTFPWERMAGESNRWYMRFHDYLMLGPNRTMAAAMRQNGCKPNASRAWREKSITWDWHRRAEAYDAHQAELAMQMKTEVMHSGLALDYQRVRSLKRIAENEEQIILDMQEEAAKDKLGLNELLTKKYGTFVSSYQKNLDALSQETGGRVKRINVKRELKDYAIELARSQGYEEAVAIQIAEMLALEDGGRE